MARSLVQNLLFGAWNEGDIEPLEVVKDDFRVKDAIGCVMHMEDQVDGLTGGNWPGCREPSGGRTVSRIGWPTLISSSGNVSLRGSTRFGKGSIDCHVAELVAGDGIEDIVIRLGIAASGDVDNLLVAIETHGSFNYDVELVVERSANVLLILNREEDVVNGEAEGRLGNLEYDFKFHIVVG
jgi:hypothetical protein